MENHDACPLPGDFASCFPFGVGSTFAFTNCLTATELSLFFFAYAGQQTQKVLLKSRPNPNPHQPRAGKKRARREDQGPT